MDDNMINEKMAIQTDEAIYIIYSEFKKHFLENEDKEDKERTLGYKIGEMNMLTTLRDQGLLKQGAITTLASLKGVTQQTLTNQMRRLKQTEKNKDILLNNRDSIDYFDEPSE